MMNNNKGDDKSKSGLQTVGSNTAVASAKFTGLIDTEEVFDSSSEEEDNRSYSNLSKSSGSKLSRGEVGSSTTPQSFGVDNSVAKVKFQGIMGDEDDETDSENETNPNSTSSNSASQQRSAGYQGNGSNGNSKHVISQKLTTSVSAGQLTVPNLTVNEDYFSLPEGNIGQRSIKELELDIEKCKLLIREAVPHTDNAKNLIRKLVQLRLKHHELKEGPPQTDNAVVAVMSHTFRERPWGSAKGYCERCNSMIIGIVQTWLSCDVCGFCCHKRCLNLISRTCAGVKVQENPTYILDICPLTGLHTQNYRCAECRAAIGFLPGMREARLCDYNGQFYCDYCHWNDTAVILSRILNNWDFTPRKICRQSKQWLKLMMRKAVVRVQDINPMLFSYLEELNQVKKLREEILIMKKYFLECEEALKNRLLVQLQERQHFVDNSDMYSVQDLVDLANDVLLPELSKIHASFSQHIKVDCEVCRSKGNKCGLCTDDEILFPFDNSAFLCPNCAFVMHRHCFISGNHKCPSCLKQQLSMY